MRLFLSKRITILFIIVCFNINETFSQKLNFREIPMPDSYPKVTEQNYLGENYSNGMPTKILQMKSKDPVAVILNYFENQWKAKGYQVTRGDIGNEMKTVNALVGPRWNIMKSVVVYSEPNSKQTMIFSSSSQIDLKGNVGVKGEQPQDLPIYPGAEIAYSYEANEGGYSKIIVHYSKASLSKNLSYYKSQMIAKGWKIVGELEPNQNQKRKNFLMFEKSNKTCSLSFEESTQMPGTLIMMQLMNK